MSKTIKLALVGCGARGREMVRLAVKSRADVVAVAACDTDEERLHDAGEDNPGIGLFADYGHMLDETDIDALVVATPATFHAELCCEALPRDIYVLSEVPAVVDLAEAETLWQADSASKAFYMLGANQNLLGCIDAAADLVQKGLLGAPYYMEAEYIHDIRYLFEKTPWRRVYGESIRYCTHSLGPLLRLIDEDLEWVSCFGTGSHIGQDPSQNDAMVAIFRTPSNVVVRLLTSFVNNYPGAGHGYRIHGTKGYFEQRQECAGAGPAKTFFYSTEAHTEKELVELPANEILLEPNKDGSEHGHGGADYVLLMQFFNAISNGLPSPISLREGLRMMLPGVYAAQSARAGGALTQIKYPWSSTA